MIIVMKSICKYTNVRTYNTNTHKRDSYNDKNNMMIRMIIVMKSNASTHMYVHTTQTQTHTKVIVIIMIT